MFPLSTRRPLTALLAAALAIGLAGCATDGDAVATPLPAPADEAPAGDEPMPVEPGGGIGDGPVVVEPAPGTTVRTRVASWDSAEVLGDDMRTVRLTFFKGVDPCDVLDSVEVTSDDETVTITLLVGASAEAGDVACIEILQQFAVDVVLDEPVGQRRLVDGATNAG